MVVCNFGDKTFNAYRMGCPAGQWACILNTADDDSLAVVQTENKPMQGFENSICLEVPALSTTYYQLQRSMQ
jgi:1,4-alpha-glucan branching enzyme